MGVLRGDKGKLGSRGSDRAPIQITGFRMYCLKKDEIDEIGWKYSA